MTSLEKELSELKNKPFVMQKLLILLILPIILLIAHIVFYSQLKTISSLLQEKSL
jgi:hypothetical protein